MVWRGSTDLVLEYECSDRSCTEFVHVQIAALPDPFDALSPPVLATHTTTPGHRSASGRSPRLVSRPLFRMLWTEGSAMSSDGWTRAAMVVGGVVRRADEVLLVHEHTLGGEGPDQWVLPGGRLEPGELLDAAVRREIEEETGLTARSVGSLAFASQHYAPGRSQPLLFLAFNAEVEPGQDDLLEPNDPDGLIIESRFVSVPEAIDLVLSAGVFPGSQSTADFLRQDPGSAPPFSLWDLNRATDRPIAKLPEG